MAVAEEAVDGGGAGGSGEARRLLDHTPRGLAELGGRSGGQSCSRVLGRRRCRGLAAHRDEAGAWGLNDGQEGLEQVRGASAELGGGSKGTAEVWSSLRAATTIGARRGRLLPWRRRNSATGL